MFTSFFTIFLLLLATTVSCNQEQVLIDAARTMVNQARTSVRVRYPTLNPNGLTVEKFENHGWSAVRDCDKLYDESEYRLRSFSDGENNYNSYYSDSLRVNDALTWVSGVLANHRTCLDGLSEMGLSDHQTNMVQQNLTMALDQILTFYNKKARDGGGADSEEKRQSDRPEQVSQNKGVLTSWNPSTSKADFVVAKDGTGTHKTINEALDSLARVGSRRRDRVVIYVKAGVYNEKVEIERNMKNIMFVGDGMDRTIVTNNRNVPDGSSTYSSATFGISADGFWARDMTFENTAGPQKHQAVALRSSSDLSIFYRCSFKGYQDTLFVHSLRQFYRDCHVYGTIDFIFGDASTIFQNCDILVRRPMDHQANMITAQGRDNLGSNTGISIQYSRVRPASDLAAAKNSFRSYLGRPWKQYSRTVFLKTDLDGLIDPKGWDEWYGNFALNTLYYAEYMNTGSGANTDKRVNWPGFHVLRNPQEAGAFSVNRFIQGQYWIPVTGVPFWAGI